MKDFIAEALDEQDLNLIDCWRRLILVEDRNSSYNYNRMCEIEDLLIPWANAKSQFLYKLFGHKTIISRHVKIEKDFKLLVRDYNDNVEVWAHKLTDKLIKIMQDNNPNEHYLEKLNFYSEFAAAESIVSNVYNGDTVILKDSQGNRLKLQKGMKLMKAYHSIIEFYNLQNEVLYYFDRTMTFEAIYNYLRNFQSQIRNDAYLEGDLSLSIHPLDYMTMSDNDCGWDSCMRWRGGGGDYRQGTIEMMNSPYVVVAYLESKSLFKYCDITWNNKKWRQLFIVSRDCIAAVKGYPYQNDTFTDIVLKWLTQLAKTNLNWDYLPNYYQWHDDNNIINNNKNELVATYIRFITNNMYNDFGTLPYHLMKLASEDLHITLEYSGPSECMICGDTYFNNGGATELITCFKCSEDPNHYCCRCGNRIDEDDIYRFDDWDSDEEYCEDCFYDLGIVCPVCGEYVHNSETLPIYLIESKVAGTMPVKELIKQGTLESTSIGYICKNCDDQLCEDPTRYLVPRYRDTSENYYALYTDKDHTMFIYVITDWDSIRYIDVSFNDIYKEYVIDAIKSKEFQRIY